MTSTYYHVSTQLFSNFSNTYNNESIVINTCMANNYNTQRVDLLMVSCRSMPSSATRLTSIHTAYLNCGHGNAQSKLPNSKAPTPLVPMNLSSEENFVSKKLARLHARGTYFSTARLHAHGTYFSTKSQPNNMPRIYICM